MDIIHCNNHFLGDADYFSRLGADLCYNPLLRDYIQQIHAFKQQSPSPTDMPMNPENMLYYRGPRLPRPSGADPSPLSVADDTAIMHGTGLQHLATWPVTFGMQAPSPSSDSCCLYNSDLTSAAGMFARYDWAVYGFNSGHFLLSIRDLGLPFNVVLACDPFANGRALFQEFPNCPTTLFSAPSLLDHVRGSGLTSKMTGYLIHLHQYTTSEPTTKFWELQASIVTKLRLIRSLSIVAAFVHPDHDSRAVSTGFVAKLRTDR